MTNDSLDSAGSHCSTPSDRQAKEVKLKTVERACVSLRGERAARSPFRTRYSMFHSQERD